MNKPENALVILAAGDSSRLGHPKQLVLYEGVTLIERLIAMVGTLESVQIYVVLGAHKELIAPKFENANVKVLINEAWETGMASSIHLAIQQIEKDELEGGGVLFLVSDQPFLTKEHLSNMLVTLRAYPDEILASSYNNTAGVPVWFPRKYFEELKNLKGDSGAKKIVTLYKDQVRSIPFEKGEIDIDTEDDLKYLN